MATIRNLHKQHCKKTVTAGGNEKGKRPLLEERVEGCILNFCVKLKGAMHGAKEKREKIPVKFCSTISKFIKILAMAAQVGAGELHELFESTTALQVVVFKPLSE